MSPPTLLVSGLGLMGGSLAAAASVAGWRVLLHHRRPEPMAEAARRGWGEPVADLSAAREADLAVVCTPVEHVAAGVRAIAAATNAVISDVGSVKGAICSDLVDLAGRFVGSHPMCGSHLQGVGNADPQLYRGAVAIVTPVPANPPAAVALVERLWRDLGCRLVRLDPAAHDRAVAAASHLPHVLANCAARRLTDEAAPLCAGGFRDVTRVAGGSSELWLGILTGNRAEVSAAARGAAEDLRAFADALDAGDAVTVRAWLDAGRAGRARYESARG
jgi:prephenate dehydrogenase